MVIDHEEKCFELGIDPEAHFEAERKVSQAFRDLWWDEGKIHFEELHNILTEDELLAYIRWGNLHRSYPEYFTWDGARQLA